MSDRYGVAVVESVNDLPKSFDWKKVAGTNDYENQYGHIVEVSTEG